MLRIICFLAMALQFSHLFSNPESQITIIENFISPEDARTLIEFYEREKTVLDVTSNNSLHILPSSNFHIRRIVYSLSQAVLKEMSKRYALNGKRYHMDFCELTARIVGNTCEYHADNIRFECPIHGNKQDVLRLICNGECPGSKFVPNHTGWREYTALIFLNDDFEGGEIAYEDGPFNKLYKKVIPIKANMLVLTPDGPNFYHEVYLMKRGRRYSLNIFYTTERKHFLPLMR